MHNNFAGTIARIEDLPYYTSPPMQFTFTQGRHVEDVMF